MGHHVSGPLLELLEPQGRVIHDALHGWGQTFHQLRLGEPLRLPHSWEHNKAIYHRRQIYHIFPFQPKPFYV